MLSLDSEVVGHQHLHLYYYIIYNNPFYYDKKIFITALKNWNYCLMEDNYNYFYLNCNNYNYFYLNCKDIPENLKDDEEVAIALIYQNIDNYVALDTVNWANIGLYSVSTNFDGSCGNYTQTISNSPIRLTQIVSIGSSFATDIECLSFNWFIDVTSINPAWYVIAVNGKGHNLNFSPTNYPASTVFTKCSAF